MTTCRRGQFEDVKTFAPDDRGFARRAGAKKSSWRWPICRRNQRTAPVVSGREMSYEEIAEVLVMFPVRHQIAHPSRAGNAQGKLKPYLAPATDDTNEPEPQV